jgi:hypothetical protein
MTTATDFVVRGAGCSWLRQHGALTAGGSGRQEQCNLEHWYAPAMSLARCSQTAVHADHRPYTSFDLGQSMVRCATAVLGVTYVIAFVTLSGVINAQVGADLERSRSCVARCRCPPPRGAICHCVDACHKVCRQSEHRIRTVSMQAWDIKTQLKAEIRQDLLDTEMRIKCAQQSVMRRPHCMSPTHAVALSTDVHQHFLLSRDEIRGMRQR